MKLPNVLFPQPDGLTVPLSSRLWDVSLVNGIVESIEPASRRNHDAAKSNDDIASHLLLAPLCHPHLHLDKAYLLTSGCCGQGDDNHPDYSDLLPQTGSFAEALETTLVAKTRFTATDLRRRGMQLLATSYAQGVTSARVFVEVDAQAAGQGTVAVDVARELKALFKGRDGSPGQEVQVCAFAQEVLFTDEAGDKNRAAMEAVLEANHVESEPTISALGVTPYVEASREKSLQNIEWAVKTALKYDLHLDLHLDYNLKEYRGDGSDEDKANEPLIFALLDALRRHNWTEQAIYTTKGGKPKTRAVVVGHATQLTCIPPFQISRLASIIKDNHLPVHFVGLPTSDLYMMGRRPPATPESASKVTSNPRGTLPILTLIREYGLSACLGVNNVGNAFTPYGTGDPLQLACWGVGLYHAGTGPDACLLYGAISWKAREAIGMDDQDDTQLDWEQRFEHPQDLTGKRLGPVLLIENPRYIRLPFPSPESLQVPARPRLGFRDVVWDPPGVSLRRVV